MTALQVFRDEYLVNEESAVAGYTKWRKANPLAAIEWDAYRSDILAGGSPVPGAKLIATPKGRALAAAGKMVLEASNEEPQGFIDWPRAKRDFGVPTTGDAQPRFLSMLEQIPDGSAVAVEAELFTFNNPVRIPKTVRIVGMGVQDKFFSAGTRIQAGRDNMTIFEEGFTSSVKHGGSTFEYINLGSQRAGTRGWDFRNVNHWKLIRCSVAHRMDRDGVYVDIPTTSFPAGDNAYVEIENLNARLSSGFSLNVWEGGTMRVSGGYFDAPKGIYIRQSGQVVMRDGKSNHEGRLMLIEGQLNVIENWGFEQYNSNGNNVYAMEILKNGSLTVPWSGNENRIEGCMFVDHPHGSGKMLHIGPGPWGNIIDSFWQGGIGSGNGGPGQYFWNEGNNTQNRNPK